MKQVRFKASKRRIKGSHLVFVSLFAVVGTLVISVIRAQGPSISFELEDSTNLNIRADNTASNNFYYEFGNGRVSPVGAADCDDEAHHFVTNAGNEAGDGSCDSPWDLDTALAHPDAVQPGDTIWLAGGTYNATYQRNVHESIPDSFYYYYHKLKGTEANPILVRGMPGERVTLVADLSQSASAPQDPAILTIAGDYTHFHDIEVTSQRTSRADGSDSCNKSAAGISVDSYRRSPTNINTRISSVGNKLIGMIVHNNHIGINDQYGFAEDLEIADSLIYYNGSMCRWGTPVGYGIHAYSRVGELDEPYDDSRLFENNIVFDNASVQFRSRFTFRLVGRSSGHANFQLDGNSFFTTGLFAIKPDQDLSPQQIVEQKLLDDNIVIGSGGHEPRDNILTDNVTYYPLEYPATNGEWRYKNRNFHMGGVKTTGSPGHLGGCRDSLWLDNYSVGGLGWWVHPTCFPEEYNYLPLNNNSGPEQVAGNTFIGTNVPGSGQENVNTEGDQQYFMDYYPDNTWIDKDDQSALPSDNWVSVRASNHMAGRAYIRLFNWQDLASVSVPLEKSGLVSGQQYEVRDAQNFFAEPVATGTYTAGESVEIPMRNLSKASPTDTGNIFRDTIPHTAPLFGTFVVVPIP